MQTPQARHIPVERTFHGDTFVDDFEWMREKTSPEVIEFLEAHNAYTAEGLKDQADLRATLVSEVKSRTDENETSHAFLQRGWWYFSRTYEGKDYTSYHRVQSENRPDPHQVHDGEQLLFDGNELAQGHAFFSAPAFSVSPDNSKVVLAYDVSGDELYSMRVLDIASGEVLEEAVSDMSEVLAWAGPDHIVYGRRDEAWRSHEVWLHKLGDDPANDTLVYREDDDMFWVWFSASRDGKWIVISSASKTTSEVRLLPTDLSSDPFVVLERQANLDYSVEVAGDRLVILHNLTHQDFEVAIAPLGSSTPDQWTTLLSAQPGERISAVDAFESCLVVEMRQGGYSTLVVLDYDGTTRPIDAPSMSTLYLSHNLDWQTDSFDYYFSSLLDPRAVYEYDLETGTSTLISQSPVPNYVRDDYDQVQEWATATDGTQVPMTLAFKKGVTADGTNPVFLYGYGSYEASTDPMFNAQRISLLDRGVVYVIAHIRGGGEMGRAWYDNGKMLSKKNTFTDFIDCATALVESGWAAEGKIAASGGSAGGLLMGAVANMAPEKFAVIDAVVPFVDALTTILKPELPLTVGEWEEWGNPIESKEVYEYMKSYSPYENVKAQTYPPMLATTSLNDTRVFYVEPAKWITKLQEIADGGPFYLKTEMVAGHAGPSGRTGRWEEVAFRHAFVLDAILN